MCGSVPLAFVALCQSVSLLAVIVA